MRSLLRKRFKHLQSFLFDNFGLGPAATSSLLGLVVVTFALALFWFIHSAPPSTLIITSGPPDSVFRNTAEKYRKILARNGVRLKILTSQGSQENLQRLIDPRYRVDIGFVQGGLAKDMKIDNLVSLGSLFNEPLLVFYRGTESLGILSALAGKRLAVGLPGSGTHTQVLALLKANGIEANTGTTFVGLNSTDAAQALLEGNVDAVFLMGDSASVPVIRKLLHDPAIRLMSFAQADAYPRRFIYLNKLVLPRGSIDFGKDIPRHDKFLVGPTVEFIARQDLHPALSDLLLEAAQEIHGGPSLLHKQGEFPAPLQHEFPISEDALRYYKSGKSFLYRYLPYWLASLVNRLVVVIVPVFVLLIPGLRIIPAVLSMRMKLALYQRYRALLALERDLWKGPSSEKRQELIRRLDTIMNTVNRMKVPVSFAGQFYELLQHIDIVRARLLGSSPLS